MTEYLRRVHQVLSCTYTCTCTSTCTSSYLTLPNLQSSYIPYLPTCMQEPPQQGIIHSFIYSSTPSLPPSWLPAWYICISVCVPVRLCVRVSPCICPRICPCACTYIHTYPCIPTKGTIAGTYQRYMYTCVLGYVVVSYFKNNICRSDRHKKTTRRTSVHPPCLSQLHSVNFYVQAKQISLFKLVP